MKLLVGISENLKIVCAFAYTIHHHTFTYTQKFMHICTPVHIHGRASFTYPISRKICLISARTFIKGWKCPRVGGTPSVSKLYALKLLVFQEPLKL